MRRIKELWGRYTQWRDARIRNRLIAPYAWAALLFGLPIFIFLASGADGPITPFEIFAIPLIGVLQLGTILLLIELSVIGLELIFPSLRETSGALASESGHPDGPLGAPAASSRHNQEE